MSLGFFVLALAVLVFAALGAVASFAGFGVELAKRRGARWAVVACRVAEGVPFCCGAAFVFLVLGFSWPALIASAVVYFVFDAVTCKASGWLLRFYDRRAESGRV